MFANEASPIVGVDYPFIGLDGHIEPASASLKFFRLAPSLYIYIKDKEISYYWSELAMNSRIDMLMQLVDLVPQCIWM